MSSSKIYRDDVVQKALKEVLIHFLNEDPSININKLVTYVNKHESDIVELQPKDYYKYGKISSMLDGIFLKLNVQDILDFKDEEIDITINGVIPIIFNEDTQETRWYDIYVRIIIPKLFVSGQGHKAPVILTATEDSYELIKEYVARLVSYNGDLYIQIQLPYVTQEVDEAQDLDLTVYSLNDKITIEVPEDPQALIVEFECQKHFIGSVPNHDPIINADKLVRSDVIRNAVVTDTKNISSILPISTPQDLLLVKEVYPENPTLPPDQQPIPDSATLAIKYNDSIIWTKDYPLNAIVNESDITLVPIEGYTLEGIYDKPESEPSRTKVTFPVTLDQTKVFYATYTKTRMKTFTADPTVFKVKSINHPTYYFESLDEFMQNRDNILAEHNNDLSDVVLEFSDNVESLSHMFEGTSLEGFPRWIYCKNLKDASYMFAYLKSPVTKFNNELCESILANKNIKDFSYMFSGIVLAKPTEIKVVPSLAKLDDAFKTVSITNKVDLPPESTGINTSRITIYLNNEVKYNFMVEKGHIIDPCDYLEDLHEGLYVDQDLKYRVNRPFRINMDIELYIKPLDLNDNHIIQIHSLNDIDKINSLVEKEKGDLSKYTILFFNTDTYKYPTVVRLISIVNRDIRVLPHAIKVVDSTLDTVLNIRFFTNKDVIIPETFFSLCSKVKLISPIVSKQTSENDGLHDILTQEHTKYLYNLETLYGFIELENLDYFYPETYEKSIPLKYDQTLLYPLDNLVKINHIIVNDNTKEITKDIFKMNSKLKYIGHIFIKDLNLLNIPLLTIPQSVETMNNTFSYCKNVKTVANYWDTYPNIKAEDVFKEVKHADNSHIIPVNWGAYQNKIVTLTFDSNGGNLIFEGSLIGKLNIDKRLEDLESFTIPLITSGWANYDLLGFQPEKEYSDYVRMMKPNNTYGLSYYHNLYAFFGHEVLIEYYHKDGTTPFKTDTFYYIENRTKDNPYEIIGFNDNQEVKIEGINETFYEGSYVNLYEYKSLYNKRKLIIREI